MVFKRRIPKTLWVKTKDFFYPRIGWQRAVNYLAHRIQRLPDTPDRIARGMAVGVFVTFSPLFGFHFIISALVAWLIRGNVIAALLATFFGNPLTFPLIGVISYRCGIFLLGMREQRTSAQQIRHDFARAMETLWINMKSLFGGVSVPWQTFSDFFISIFMPYLIGGIVPGLICGLMTYMIFKPLISVYQNRRKGRIIGKIHALRTAALSKKSEAKKSEEKDES